MLDPLLAKLEPLTHLSDDDRRALQALAGRPARRYEPDTIIVREGEDPQMVRLLLSGWAHHYKELPDGRRQMVALSLPGDLRGFDTDMLFEMDHSIGALSAVTLIEIRLAAFEEMMSAHPRVMRALHRQALVDAAVQREWLLNLGRRTATERLAHLFCELFHRLRGIGQTEGNACDIPLTQADLADLVGITPVHVSRVLQTLRAQQLIALRGRRLTLPNLQALERAALFNPRYLRLGRIGARAEA